MNIENFLKNVETKTIEKVNNNQYDFVLCVDEEDEQDWYDYKCSLIKRIEGFHVVVDLKINGIPYCYNVRAVDGDKLSEYATLYDKIAQIFYKKEDEKIDTMRSEMLRVLKYNNI